MAEYRIICAIRGPEGRLQALGYSERGSAVMYDGTWTLEEARRVLDLGHRLYVVDPATGARSDFELPTGEDDDHLPELPDCGRTGFEARGRPAAATS